LFKAAAIAQCDRRSTDRLMLTAVARRTVEGRVFEASGSLGREAGIIDGYASVTLP
jgi:hypothetical protein